jgi:hypothetical protein
MAAVGADHQTILARGAQDVGQIVGVLARQPQVIDGQRIRRTRFYKAPRKAIRFQKPYFSTAAMAVSKAGLSFARLLTSR